MKTLMLLLAMYTALGQLGYRSYHFMEGAKNNSKTRDLVCWIEAMKHKIYGTGQPYTGADFDKILQNYNVSLKPEHTVSQRRTN